ncbi:unnamed protein product, partial [Prorocentrum cordatum]
VVRAGMLIWAGVATRAPERRAAAAARAVELSAREPRAQENAACIGSARSPWKAVRKRPQAARTSAMMVRGVVEDELVQALVVNLLGTDVGASGHVRDWPVANVAARVTQVEPDDIYASATLEAELSGAEVDRLIATGFAVWCEAWPRVLAACGGALASKLARVAKTRDNGALEVRNVFDLRRSGYSEMVDLPDMVALPRLGESTECFAMIANFEDALHALGVVGYRTVLCGGPACPLPRGRAAAFLGRSGQGMFDEKELHTQTYVDDPATV